MVIAQKNAFSKAQLTSDCGQATMDVETDANVRPLLTEGLGQEHQGIVVDENLGENKQRRLPYES